MLRTSIQACGTATTTSAPPKPSLSISITRASTSGIISRTRSSPEMPGDAVLRIVQLENHAGVIVEAAPIGGGEADAPDIDAAGGEETGAALEEVKRRVESETGRGRKGPQLGGGLVRIARNGEEF